MAVINAGICLDFCAHLCMEIRASPICSLFSECLCVCSLLEIGKITENIPFQNFSLLDQQEHSNSK
jgi:hypothetical protein